MPQAKNVRVTYYDMEGYNSFPGCGLKSIRWYKEETVNTIDFRAGNGNFAGSGKKDKVSALFHGTLQFPQQGRTELCLTIDDEARVRIDDELVFDQDCCGRSCKEVTIHGDHKVEVEFFEKRT